MYTHSPVQYGCWLAQQSSALRELTFLVELYLCCYRRGPATRSPNSITAVWDTQAASTAHAGNEDTEPSHPLQEGSGTLPTVAQVQTGARNYERILAAPHGKPHRLYIVLTHFYNRYACGGGIVERNSSPPPSYILSVVSPSLWRGMIEVVSTSSKATQALSATSLMRRLLPPHAPKSGLERLVPQQ